MRTRPTTSWSDLRHGSVGLFGLGVEGGANLRRLRTLGVTPVVVDDDPGVDSADGLEVLSGAPGRDALARCDVVIKTPGISRYGPDVESLERAGVLVVGGLGLWMQEAPVSQVACVTGTKGKSTTTAVAGHLLTRLGRRVMVGGNLGLPPWDPDAGGDADLWVIETSSFQATDVARAPGVSAVTSLSPDHLDWHGDVATYFADKLSLCTLPGARCTVADGTSRALRAHSDRLGSPVVWVEDPSGQWDEALGLRGPHNRRNAEIARQVAMALGVDEAEDLAVLASAAEGFDALPNRLETVAVVDGVEYVDDSLSTNVAPALAALETFANQRVAILVGGFDRGLDYAPLAQGLASRDVNTLVVTMPDCGPRIGEAVRQTRAPHVETIDVPDLRAGVAAAHQWCQGQGVVLLSPAAPSFGRFRDYRERSSVFADAVRSLSRPAARSG